MRVLVPLLAVMVGCGDVGEIEVLLGLYSSDDVVLFYGPSGNLLAEVEADGRAELRGPMVAGGSVLRVEDVELGFAQWILGVQPGDRLDLSEYEGGRGYPPGGDDGHAQLQLPPLPAGTESVTLYTSCGRGPGGSATHAVKPSGIYDVAACDYDFDLVVRAGPGAAPLWLVTTGVSTDMFRDGVVEGEFGRVDELRIDTGGLSLDAASLRSLRDGLPGFVFELEEPGAEVVFPHLPALGDDFLLGATVHDPDFSSTSQVYQRLGAASQPRLAEPLPSIGGLLVERDGLSWPGDSDGADLVFVSAGRWNIVAPPGTREIRAPGLPARLAGVWKPFDFAMVQMVEVDGVAGWDEARRLQPERWNNFWLEFPVVRTSTAFGLVEP